MWLRAQRALRRGAWRQALLVVSIAIFLLLTFVPILMMLVMSFKDNAQIYAFFWQLPNPWRIENYRTAWNAISGYLLNSIYTSLLSVVGVVILSSLSGFTFARHRFPGKEILYLALLSLLMIPGILTLIPRYVLIFQMGLINTHLGLILPWTAGGQVFGILLCRTFFSTLPEELFEAARIDGASEFRVFSLVAIPLAWPILITLSIFHLLGTYNDYLWPLLVIRSTKLQVITVGLTQFTSEYGITDLGPQIAGYVIASVPLLIVFLLSMRYFIQGLTAGALKA